MRLWIFSVQNWNNSDTMTRLIRGTFEKFVDWLQCASVIQREGVTAMPSCSGGVNVVVAGSSSLLTTVRVWVTAVLKEPFLGWRSNYKGRLKSSWTRLITPSRKFVEVRWRSLSRSTSLGKRYTSYNAPPTPRKLQEESVTGGFGSTNLSNGPRSCSTILKKVLLKWP
jgi:hypothetical protein